MKKRFYVKDPHVEIIASIQTRITKLARLPIRSFKNNLSSLPESSTNSKPIHKRGFFFTNFN